MKCIIRLGDFVEGLINVFTLGHGKTFAGWIALKLGYKDCGCERRRLWLNQLCGCQNGIQL
jgi:hypothetical protein